MNRTMGRLTFVSGRAPRSRNTCRSLAVALAALLGGVRNSQAQMQLDVTITADNAYAFGYGQGQIDSVLYGPVHNCTSADIFSCATGAETYRNTVVPSGHGGLPHYVYIAAWSDNLGTQGLLAEFQVPGHPPARTGVGDWQVFATGIDLDCGSGSEFPLLQWINEQIARADSSTGGPSSSIGWVPTVGGLGRGSLVIGENNVDQTPSASPPVGPNNFSPVCTTNGLAAAYWIWYAHEDSLYCGVSEDYHDPNNVFNTNLPSGGCAYPYLNREFLIFRLRVEEIPGLRVPSIPTVSTWGLVVLTLLMLLIGTKILFARRETRTGA